MRSNRSWFRYNFFTNRNWKIRALQVLSHIIFVYALLQGPSWWWLASIAVYFVMFCVGVNIGVHRYFSHASFETHPIFEKFFGVAMCLASLGSPLAWAGMHRMHHRYSDSVKDPHTPLVNQQWSWGSAFRTYLGLWREYHASLRETQELRKMPLHKFLHFYYFAVIFSYIAILSLFGWNAVIYLYFVPAVFSFHAASMIVTVGHMVGDRPNPTRDQSRNNVVLHWLTFGEGLHNEHHAYPKNYIYKSTSWYFLDVPGLLIEYVFKNMVHFFNIHTFQL